MTDYYVTKNYDADGGDTEVVGGKLTILQGAEVTGLTGQTTFASAAEAKAGTVTNKVIAPDTLKAALHDMLANVPWDAEITVGTETGGTTINVAIQLEDIDDADLTARASVNAYLSDAAAGEAISTAAPSGHVAIGTDGGCVHLVTDLAFILTSETTGHIDLNIIEAASHTWYLVVVLPNGKKVVSGAIAIT